MVRKIDTTYFTSQRLTGHGGFAHYLHRFKRGDNPSCQCDPNIEETALHVLTDCPVFGRQRLELENNLDIRVTKENLPSLIKLKSSAGFISYCTKIIKIVNRKNRK